MCASVPPDPPGYRTCSNCRLMVAQSKAKRKRKKRRKKH
jgi:hypothetical protein